MREREREIERQIVNVIKPNMNSRWEGSHESDNQLPLSHHDNFAQNSHRKKNLGEFIQISKHSRFGNHLARTQLMRILSR